MKNHLMTATESRYGADRDLDGPLDPKYQDMMDRTEAAHAARVAAAAMLDVVLNGTAEEVADYATSETCAKMRQATAAGAYGKELAGLAKNIVDVSVPAKKQWVKKQDTYTTLAAGKMQCISATMGADGQRNTHVISYHSFFRPGTRDLAYMVDNCSDCIGWDKHGACRHANIVTALLNHAVIANEVQASCEIVKAEIYNDSVCTCGSPRHGVFLYVTGRGYLSYHLCLALVSNGDSVRECMKGILI